MKILKIKAPSGYKMLEKGFEINFLTKTRVDKDSNNDDLIELEPNFYYPKETVFVGKNSSGKTTALDYIECALDILTKGRVSKDMSNNNGTFEIEIIFYVQHKIYWYVGSFINKEIDGSDYLSIVNEELKESDYKASAKKDLSNLKYKVTSSFVSNAGEDTSNVYKYSNIEDELYLNVSQTVELAGMFGITERIVNMTYGDNDVFMKIVHLFDDSIEIVKTHYDEKSNKTDYYDFKRIGEDTKIVSADVLANTLSSGTIRGVILYGLLITTFSDGGIIIIDKIEKNFNKNLIGNLINMVNDPSVNKAGASIIYSTHYSELLDETNRSDNINVLHRYGTTITLKNMHSDYNTRTDLLKSKQFDQNCFDNNINYDHLLDLKKAIRG